ncbi:hypothetical protein KP509_17G028000 [Ceratopteris richardii]|uniref:Uncharacterized protein n=1 Tax=Ceratopteris richardii TaxID=49495 RepID=A0A8T2QLC4_CERRI|nr:hypothetical protein KP509_33G004500 [Ceratopteris richardii]KAH7372903.1 hypothetical protein KP509_17G028000 [Ceratopteris richardii]
MSFSKRSLLYLVQVCLLMSSQRMGTSVENTTVRREPIPICSPSATLGSEQTFSSTDNVTVHS